jgi:hypothetical protein
MSEIDTEIDPLDGLELPAHWTPAARDAVASVLELQPELAGSDLAQLEQAAELITAADMAAEVARAAGMLATGSMGQTVAHPLVAEARQARAAAASILSRLALPPEKKSATERARFAASSRWHPSRKTHK